MVKLQPFLEGFIIHKGIDGMGTPGVYICYIAELPEFESKLMNIEVLREFPDVFLEELQGLPPYRIVDFHIDLILVATPILRAS